MNQLNNNKFNKFLKAIKLRRFIRGNRTARRGKFLNRVGRSNYSFPIATDPIVWKTPEYTTQNLRIETNDVLANVTQFQTLTNMYQYYKINAVALKVIPKCTAGYEPPTGWAYMTGNEDQIFYPSIPSLPGAKLIKGNKTQTIYFKRVGRQQDFNWYYDTKNMVDVPTFSIRVRFAEPPTENAKYIFQLKFFLTFSMMIERVSNKGRVEEPEEVLQYVKKPEIKPEIIKKMVDSTISLNESSISISSHVSSKTDNSKIVEERKRINAERRRQKLAEFQKFNATTDEYLEKEKLKIKPKKIREAHFDSEAQESINTSTILPTGQKVISKEPLTKAQINQITTEQIDKSIKDKWERRFQQILLKEPEKQVQSLENMLKEYEKMEQWESLSDKDEMRRAKVRTQLKKIQDKLAEELLENS